MRSIALHLLAIIAFTLPVSAADKNVKQDPGPNGGRVLRKVEPKLEFLVTKDRRVEIVALTKDYKPAKLSGQLISVTAGERSQPTKLEFQEQDGKLLSTNKLPEGNGFPVSVGIKANASARPVYERFNLNLEKCPTCKYAEYACICGHE